MKSLVEQTERPAPIFGLLSIAAPIAGIAYVLLYRVSTGDDDFGLGGMAFGFCGLMLGMFLGCIGLLRKEKYLSLSRVGFLLSSFPFLYVVVASRSH